MQHTLTRIDLERKAVAALQADGRLRNAVRARCDCTYPQGRLARDILDKEMHHVGKDMVVFIDPRTDLKRDTPRVMLRGRVLGHPMMRVDPRQGFLWDYIVDALAEGELPHAWKKEAEA